METPAKICNSVSKKYTNHCETLPPPQGPLQRGKSRRTSSQQPSSDNEAAARSDGLVDFFCAQRICHPERSAATKSPSEHGSKPARSRGTPEADYRPPKHKSSQRGESVAKRPTREPARKSTAMRSKPPCGPKRKRRATAKEPGFSLASTASQRTRPSGPVRSVEIVRIVDGRRDLNHIV